MPETVYIALLRGINVGGHKPVNMAELKNVFEVSGYSQVKTILNSGNVVFQAKSPSEKDVAKDVQNALTKALGYDISVMVRSIESLKDLVKSDPFKGREVTKQTRLYVSFLAEKPKVEIHIPFKSELGDFEILSVKDREICSILTLSEHFKTTESMNILEKTFGKQITTRNWNTVLRLVKLFP